MKWSATALVVMLAALVGGCTSGPTHDSVMRDTVSSLQRGVDVLKGVSDEESAIDARPKLTEVQKELRASKTKLEKLDPPTAKEMERLATKYEGQLDQLSSEFEREVRRISQDRNVAKHLVGATSLP